MSSARAWGAEGHRLIAELAQKQLTLSATAEVDRLLGLEPGATMVSVSTWADEKRAPATAPLHYVNPPEGACDYDRQRDCRDGRCVVEAITAKVAILKSRASDAERLAALKWVIHLVGDVHQPLHVGLAHDKGGNLYQVRAFGRGSNLHAVWDSAMLKRLPYSAELVASAAAAVPAVSVRSDPAAWASESCALSRSADFYPEDRKVDAAYLARWDATLVRQLARAGMRLAATLNEALGSAPAARDKK
ncbi:hypothetical protein ASC95_01270 [Pelomonas sp. Root1217]|uniref:S1/P1 nuclease n=1 Tax=Pelomonas sp. Root1217 TaxID=1736430 RepID=UPI00070FBF61|nr:S1/P1 nuclease [Pelomonas sp. Root1217]KQV60137.1 hypothetical protein ASC95_01270 [Pelomonas sp. Root1217]